MAKKRRKKVKGNRKGVLRSGRRNTYKKFPRVLKTAPERKHVVIDWSTPRGEGGVEACKERVANGMKCYCLQHCTCRNCIGVASCTSHFGHTDNCIPECKTCSNHKPCC